MMGNARYFEKSDEEALRSMAADIRFDVLKAFQEEFLAGRDRLLSSVRPGTRGHGATSAATRALPAWEPCACGERFGARSS